MTKVACKECGAMILPSTAKDTGGICMACKQGIRKQLDESRAYYAQLKEHDPFRELWVSLVKRSDADRNLLDFSAAERTYFVTCRLEGEVYNGGFDQYFSNSSGDHFYEAVAALEEIGALQSLKIVREAAAVVFDRGVVPRDQELRWQAMRIGPGQSKDRAPYSANLEKLDDQFYRDEDQLANLLLAYAKKNNLTKPFELEP